MSDTEDRLFDLLDQWSHLHQQGKEVVVEELCRDCPELVHELQRRISVLQKTDWLDRPIDDEPVEGNKPADFGLPDHLGRYRLDELIGDGGFGQVWRAFDTELHRNVAIKIPRPDRISTPNKIEQFIQEARRVAQLKHPGNVPIYDVGRDEERCYIVSDLVEGKNLAEVMLDGLPSQEEACRIVTEVARVLNHAHDLGFIHRDVKPANILLDEQGKTFLTDFGIAATVEELADDERPSVGTLAYMSPEQVAGELVDPRTDIYSLGVVLVELLTGERIGASNDPASLLESASIPAELKAVCRKCLTEDRDDRFQKASELAEALAGLGKKASRVGVWIGGIGTVILLGILVVLWKSQSRHEPKRSEVPPQTPAASEDHEFIELSGPRNNFDVASPVSALAFDTEAGKVVVGTVDGTAVLFDHEDEAPPIKLENAAEVTALAVAPNGSRIACGCDNGLVRMWAVSQSSPRELDTLAGHPGRIHVLSFNDDGSALVAASGNTAQVWDLTISPPQMAELPEAEGSILAVDFAGDELAVGIGSTSEKPGHLWFWRVALNEQQLHPIDTKTLERVTGVEDIAFSPDGRFVAVVHDDGKVAGLELEIHPAHRRRAIRMFGFLDRPSAPISGITVVPGDDFRVAVGRGSHVELWQLRTSRQVARIEEPNSIRHFVVSEDGQSVVTGTETHVRLWQLPKNLQGDE